MTPDDNVKTVQKIYDAFGRGDVPAVLAQLGPELEIHEPESLPFGGVYRGPQGFLQLLSKIAETVRALEIKPERIFGQDDVVVVMSRLSGVVSGSPERVGTPLIERWTFRDGRPAELWAFYFDAAALTPAPPHAAA